MINEYDTDYSTKNRETFMKKRNFFKPVRKYLHTGILIALACGASSGMSINGIYANSLSNIANRQNGSVGNKLDHQNTNDISIISDGYLNKDPGGRHGQFFMITSDANYSNCTLSLAKELNSLSSVIPFEYFPKQSIHLTSGLNFIQTDIPIDQVTYDPLGRYLPGVADWISPYDAVRDVPKMLSVTCRNQAGDILASTGYSYNDLLGAFLNSEGLNYSTQAPVYLGAKQDVPQDLHSVSFSYPHYDINKFIRASITLPGITASKDNPVYAQASLHYWNDDTKSFSKIAVNFDYTGANSVINFPINHNTISDDGSHNQYLFISLPKLNKSFYQNFSASSIKPYALPYDGLQSITITPEKGTVPFYRNGLQQGLLHVTLTYSDPSAVTEVDKERDLNNLFFFRDGVVPNVNYYIHQGYCTPLLSESASDLCISHQYAGFTVGIMGQQATLKNVATTPDLSTFYISLNKSVPSLSDFLLGAGIYMQMADGSTRLIETQQGSSGDAEIISRPAYRYNANNIHACLMTKSTDSGSYESLGVYLYANQPVTGEAIPLQVVGFEPGYEKPQSKAPNHFAPGAGYYGFAFYMGNGSQKSDPFHNSLQSLVLKKEVLNSINPYFYGFDTNSTYTSDWPRYYFDSNATYKDHFISKSIWEKTQFPFVAFIVPHKYSSDGAQVHINYYYKSDEPDFLKFDTFDNYGNSSENNSYRIEADLLPKCNFSEAYKAEEYLRKPHK